MALGKIATKHVGAFAGGVGGGGGEGTSNYNDLSNKPKVNGTTLSGNKSSADLGIRKIIELTPTTPGGEQGTLTAAQMAEINADPNAVVLKLELSESETVYYRYTTDISVGGASAKVFYAMGLNFEAGAAENSVIQVISQGTTGIWEASTAPVHNHVTLTEAEYEALTEYADHTDYRIIEEA